MSTTNDIVSTTARHDHGIPRCCTVPSAGTTIAPYPSMRDTEIESPYLDEYSVHPEALIRTLTIEELLYVVRDGYPEQPTHRDDVAPDSDQLTTRRPGK